MFTVLKSVIFKSNIISNNITTLFKCMLKLATVDKNLLLGVKGHKTENNAFFL